MAYNDVKDGMFIHVSCCSYENLRIDVFLAQLPLRLSRSQLKRVCTKIVRNKKEAKLSHTLSYKDELQVSLERILPEEEDVVEEASQAGELDIVYEDASILVLNKAKSTLVHPGPGHSEQSIAQMVLHKLSGFSNEDLLHRRAGIVHRLDRDTTGTLLVAKTAEVHSILSRQFAERLVQKQYLAVVKRCPPKESETIHVQLARHRIQRKKYTIVQEGGKSSTTEYHVLFSKNNHSVLLFKPHTGRTHQIRVVAQSLGCPIVGDDLYSRKSGDFPDHTLQLHAYSLSFYNPEDILKVFLRNKREEKKSLSGLARRYQWKRLRYQSPVPQEMQELFLTIGFDSTELEKILSPSDEDFQEYPQDQQKER